MARALVDRANLEIRSLSADDEVSEFSCGDEDLDDFIRADALRLHGLGVVKVYLAFYQGELAGYMALLSDCVVLKTSDAKKLNMRNEDHPSVPALKVGRLATSTSFKERYRGLGSAMMAYAHAIALLVANHSGCRLITVDAYQASVGFYERLKFVRNKLRPSKRDKPDARATDPSSPAAYAAPEFLVGPRVALAAMTPADLKGDLEKGELRPAPPALDGDCVSMRFDLKSVPLPAWCLDDGSDDGE